MSTASPLSSSPEPEPSLHVEPIRCGLQDRVLGGLVELPGRNWRAILLESGRATVRDGEDSREIVAPALLWLPWNSSNRIRARAGATGGMIVLGERALSNSIGTKPEAADLRFMAERRAILSLEGKDVLLRDASGMFDLILREAEEGAPGAETVIEAQTRVLLVALWREASEPETARRASGASEQILQRFRQLVEVHFRSRRGVADYAETLGLTENRLRDICRRALGRPPLQLIHERLTREARALLERSSLTVDQVALHLGFLSAAQFSKFFKAREGVPPALYRRNVRAAAPRKTERSYADWP